MLHLARPFEEAPQVSPLVPEKLPKFHKADLLHLEAAVGLDSPQQVWAAPGSQAMPTSGVPQEAEDGQHGKMILGVRLRLKAHARDLNCKPDA